MPNSSDKFTSATEFCDACESTRGINCEQNPDVEEGLRIVRDIFAKDIRSKSRNSIRSCRASAEKIGVNLTPLILK